MIARKHLKHAWLRSALSDRGHTQHDLAEHWGCDDAVVSRFIQSGVPELTWDRANALARMLGIGLEELKLRLHEDIGLKPPNHRQNEIAAPERPKRDEVLADLKEAVQRARTLLPNEKIEVKISRVEEEL